MIRDLLLLLAVEGRERGASPIFLGYQKLRPSGGLVLNP